MITLGITGGVGTGKSTVSRLLSEMYNLKIIDADKLSKEASESKEVLDEIARVFGKQYVKDGKLDRKAMGALVFSDEKKREMLNGIIHPVVRKRYFELRDKYQSEGEEYLIYDCPLLIEAGLIADVDDIVVVYLDKKSAVKRVMQRNNISQKEALNMINAQMDIDEKLEYADYIVYNDGDLDDLKEAVVALFEEVREDNE
ncbi:MAG: dephospho-CoA kinase [Anaerofustis stercorihominis]|nr:dephospho-CoA kinase [Anaerofustis stercorihominis]